MGFSAKPFGVYFDAYLEKLDQLSRWEPGELIIGEAEQDLFVKTFGELLRLRNILSAFDEFEEKDPLSPRDLQDYQSEYIELYRQRRAESEGERKRINDDLTFEIELIKQVEVNVDYILMLVEKYRDQHAEQSRQEVREDIRRAVKSSPTFQNKLDLIERFVDSVSATSGEIDEEWKAFLTDQKAIELAGIVKEENLKQPETERFINAMFRRGHLETSGSDIDQILPRGSLFATGADSRIERKKRVIDKLKTFFDRFHTLG